MCVVLILFVYNDILRYSFIKGCFFKIWLFRKVFVVFLLLRVKSLFNEIEFFGLYCKR